MNASISYKNASGGARIYFCIQMENVSEETVERGSRFALLEGRERKVAEVSMLIMYT